MPQATRAADFVDSIGVNTHFSHGFEKGTQYGDAAKGLAAIQYLGIDLIRDQLPRDATQEARFKILADAGIKVTSTSWDHLSLDVNMAMNRKYLAANPGGIHALEGPNEVDLWRVTHEGKTGEAGAVAYQEDYFAAINADPALRDIPVYNLTTGEGAPDTAAPADNANIHAYRPNGLQPSQGLSWFVDHMKAAMPGKPMVLTETGYYTAPTNDHWGGVDERTQATMTLNTLFRADALGIQETYLYQLLDHQTDQSEANREGHFGLFDINWNPKDAADALHNLTAILGDAGAGAETFAPGALGYTVTGTAPNLATKLMQKADGTFDLVVWAEPDVWDEAANRPLAAPNAPITVKLEKAFASVKVYDPMAGSAPIATASNTDTVTIGVTDHPLIVELSGASGGGTGGGTGGGATPQPNFTPVSLSAGAGPDALVLKISQDAYQGSAQYTVKVDGAQVGGTFTASALKSSGQSDTLTLKGDWAAGAHQVSVEFLNDAWGGTAATDRNLHVDSATYNGQAVAGAAKALWEAVHVASFSFTEAAPPAAPPPVVLAAGAGPDALVLKISQDAYQGSAQYTVSVDGQQVGGTFTASAWRSAGQSDTLTLKGDWAAGAHAVEVRFLNDAWDGTAATDRNLYVDAATYNGQAVQGAAKALMSQGAQGFAFTDAAPAPAPVVKAGTDGADLFDATAAGGVFTGEGGRDLYLFEAGDGRVKITDFAPGTDKLVFIDFVREDVATAAAAEGGVSGLLVSYGGGGGTVFLAGVSALADRDLVFA